MVYRQARAPASRAAAARAGRHRRGRRGARAALHALRRVPLLHARRGAAQPRDADPRAAGRARAARVPARRDGPLQVGGEARARSFRANCCSTRSSSRATSAPSTCGRRRTTSPSGATTPCAIETAEGKAEYVRRQRGVRRARPGAAGAAARRASTRADSAGGGAGRRTASSPRPSAASSSRSSHHARRGLVEPLRGQRRPTRPRRRCRRRSRGAVSAVEYTTASTMSLPAAIAATALATGSAYAGIAGRLQHPEIVRHDHAVEAELLAGDAVPLRRQRRGRRVDRRVGEVAEHQQRRAGVDPGLERQRVGRRPLRPSTSPSTGCAVCESPGGGAVAREVLERRERRALLAARRRRRRASAPASGVVPSARR